MTRMEEIRERVETLALLKAVDEWIRRKAHG